MFLDILSRDTYQAYFTEREDSVQQIIVCFVIDGENGSE